MPRNRQPLQCAHCKQRFPRREGAGLFCGDDCKADHGTQAELNRGMLAQAGFEQHPDTPNLWMKDGVAVSEEQVKHVGFVKAVRQHESALAEHSVQ